METADETITDTEVLRRRHLAAGRRAVVDHLERIAWPPERIRAERLARLRALVAVAQERSPWHRQRLAHIDADSLTEGDLARIPPMTKDDVMAHFDEIVGGLTEVQPDILSGYASGLHHLALEARAGRLSIAPQQIVVYGEPLLSEHRVVLEEAWGVPVHNWWGTSEANVLAASCGRDRGLHLHDDLYLIEPIDRGREPVAVGERSSGVLVTNLRNLVLPLIRYELSDEVTVLEGPCPCGSSLRRIDDVHGRAEEAFRYDEVPLVHPHVFRSRLGAEPAVLDYQVIQTAHGADVRVQCAGAADVRTLQSALVEALRRCGLSQPQVSVTPVETLDRGHTGKLMRFVALPG